LLPVPEPPPAVEALDEAEPAQDADAREPRPTALPQAVTGACTGAVALVFDATGRELLLPPEPVLLAVLDDEEPQDADDLPTAFPQTVPGTVTGAVALVPDAVPELEPLPEPLAPLVEEPAQEADDPPPGRLSALPQTVTGADTGATTELPEPVSAAARLAAPAPSRTNPPVRTAASRVRRRSVRMS
jgi:hypothetical protein